MMREGNWEKTTENVPRLIVGQEKFLTTLVRTMGQEHFNKKEYKGMEVFINCLPEIFQIACALSLH